MSDEVRVLAGILMLSLVTVETGGVYLMKLWRSSEGMTPFQIGFARAGHAHAGVLLVLSLALLGYAEAADLSGLWAWLARAGVPIAAILMPAGFFLSVLGKDPERPNRLIVLLWAGAIALTAALITAGVGLIAGGVAAL